MQVATDPNLEQNADSDDEFDKHFKEFADAKDTGSPPPEDDEEPGEPEGNGPEGDEATPAEPAATEPPPTDDATSGEAKPEGGDKPPKEQAPDPFANLPDDVRAAIAAIEKDRDDARHRASSDANRVAALSRKLNELQSSTASAPAPAAEKTEAQKALDDKITQLREDYGDIADPLIELIETQRQELNTVRTVLTGLSDERREQVIAQETQALAARHPDWQEVAKSPDFQSWLQIQPPNIQGLAESWDARETSVVLTLFKSEKVEATGQGTATVATPKPDAATGARRSQQLEGSRDTRSRPAPAASEAPDDFDAAFEFFRQKRERQQMAAQRR